MTTETIQFNPMDPDFIANPHPFYRELRTHAPVHFEEALGGWVITRYDDVSKVLRDGRAVRPPAGEILLSRLPAEVRQEVSVLEQKLTTSLPFANPPHHTRLRALVSKGFTPRIINSMRPSIQRITDRLLDQIQEAGRSDLMKDFAYPVPTSVIMELVGVPEEDRPLLIDWATDIMAILGQALPSADPIGTARAASKATEEFTGYLDTLIKQRRKAPREDLLSNLIAATDEGGRLSNDELNLTVLILLNAGLETTANYLGNGTYTLLRNPHLAAELRADPSIVETAAEELLRYDGPVPITTPQVVTEAMEVGGQYIEPGQLLYAVIGAANRDPERFADPDQIDLRRPVGGVLSFGLGIHFCIGARLARLEAQIAIGSLFNRFPNLRLDDDAPPPVFRPDPLLRGLLTLPVVV